MGGDGSPRHATGEETPAEEGPLQRAVAVHPAAAEPGYLARRVQARYRLAGTVQHLFCDTRHAAAWR